MAVQYRHITQQGAVLGALGRVALAAVSQSLGSSNSTVLATPGPRFERLSGALDALVDDFIRWSGGDPKAWRGHVPHALSSMGVPATRANTDKHSISTHKGSQWGLPGLVSSTDSERSRPPFERLSA